MALEASTSALTPPIRLEDRYTQADGEVFLSGIQALVRMLLDQHRADAAAGRRTATFASGYPGSPLGGLDREIAALGALAEDHDLVHRPAVNEELAATAVWGSQLANGLPGPRFDGVVGVWYGKTPGVDRASDALRHSNFGGSSPAGGMVALCGDDPEAKSSTLPSVCEAVLAALHIPVLVPGSVQEVLDLGRHAIACSRASGLWSALKVNTVVADATATALVGPARVAPLMPEVLDDGVPYVHRPSGQLLTPYSLEMERTLHGVRTELARAYARANSLNPVVEGTAPARIGLVAAGATYQQLLEALNDLGAAGRVRILKLGMIHPLDRDTIREFAAGLDEIVVVEEKGPFLEPAIKDGLYGSSHTPLVTGERDDAGRPLVPATGVLTADLIARAIGSRLLAREDLPGVRARLEQIDAIAARPAVEVGQTRMPHFCSGCPHSVSTRAPDDALVGAGIGCHTMIMLTTTGRGQIAGVTQMGGEGAQWIGIAPFIEPRHLLQNLGDGTFHHSGSLAIRAAIAANLNVTYKLLHNQAIAMTGGQTPAGQMSVAQIAQAMAAEGVKRIIITTEDTGRYDGVALPAIAEVRDRSRLMAAQEELARTEGVTLLIHDQACATEVRRARRRGTLAQPPYRVMINERVCEGCGDCGARSGCLSLEPVDTEFGRKTRIDQTTCNTDLSCLDGDCPAFMRVIPPKRARAGAGPRTPGVRLPEPVACVAADDVRVRLVGIGGTGVVTISQVLGMAALLDGHHAAGLDQTGLSQKAGPVVSDVRLSTERLDGGVNVAGGHTDVLLGLDIVGSAVARNLAAADPQRTVAVVSTSVMPTVDMIIDVDARHADVAAAIGAINAVTRAPDNVFLDAHELALKVFGNAMPANVIVLGAAWQRGAIPLSLDAIRRAFTLNGVAVETNIAALDWGRAAVAAPDVVAAVLAEPTVETQLPPGERELVDAAAPGAGQLRRLLEIRVADLRGWGGMKAARRYARDVIAVRDLEARRLPGGSAVTEAYAVGLHRLMAYKDEYEVARLHLAGLRELPEGAKVTFMLHPPALRALGIDRKLALGRWFVPALRTLRFGRRLRGTPLDVFGYATMRRLERTLPGEYTELVTRALRAATPETAATVRALAALPDVVRGYEELKLRNVERFRADARMLLHELSA